MIKEIDDYSLKIEDLWYKEEVNGEIKINKINLLLSFILLILFIINLMIIIPIHGFQWNAITNLVGLLIFTSYNSILFYKLKHNKYRPIYKYLTVSLNITIASLILLGYSYSTGWVHSLRTSTFLIYFVIIVISGYYQRPHIPIFTGIMAAFQYSLLFFYAVFFTNTVIGRIESFQFPSISYDVYALYVSILITIGFLVGYLSKRFKFLLNRSLLSETEAFFIKETFGQYVDKDVRDELLNGRLELGGELKECTVLFVDIRNFTRLSSEISPGELVYLLNRFFSEMVDVVIDNKGITNKFIGDAMLAVFGVPLKQENHTENAVKAAISMREKLIILNKDLESMSKNKLNIGIGVHTGISLAGNIGSEQRKEYTVIGETVNLASRLENLNKRFNTDILISEETYDKVKDIVNIKGMGPTLVRGKKEPISIYQLISLKNKETLC